MAATSVVSLSYPKTRESLTKYVKVVRTDTTAFVGTVLPKDSIITGIYFMGAVASNAATTANISVGTSATATEWVNAFDVKSSTGTGYQLAYSAAAGAMTGSKLTADVPVYFKYTETGAASSAGGPWYVKLEYVVTGPGEDLLM